MMNNTLQNRPASLIRIARSLAVTWVILSLADAIITYICLQNTDNIEGNPFARTMLTYNEMLFYVMKVLVTTCVGLGFWWLASRTIHLKPMIGSQLLLVVLFLGVLGNNLLHL